MKYGGRVELPTHGVGNVSEQINDLLEGRQKALQPFQVQPVQALVASPI